MKDIGVLKWQTKSVANQILDARTISAAMAASSYFKTPNPALADVDTAADNLDAAQQLMNSNGGGTKFSLARDGCRTILQGLMTQLVGYVNNIANGNADVIKDAAIALKKTPVHKGKLGATARIAATGLVESAVKIDWQKVSGAATYHLQMSSAVSPLVWQEFSGNLVTDTKTELISLPSGDKLWFRVMAVNAAGEGAPSNPAVVRVP